MTFPPIALTIAGSDSSGGAGIQADLKTFSALGVYGASVITALTAQNTTGVSAIHVPPADFVYEQIKSVLTDLDVKAIKIGMLAESAIIQAVAQSLQEFYKGPIILDPVMVATSGDKLLKSDAEEALRKRLIPMADVITPNLAESAVLTGAPIARSEQDMERQIALLQSIKAKAVLIKGGHFYSDNERADNREAVDLLGVEGKIHRYAAQRVQTHNTHGTGCTLSSAIAAFMAKDFSLEDAVAEAKNYLTSALHHADKLKIGQGDGHGPVHHFYKSWC